MNLPWHERIGVRLGLVSACVLLLLGGATVGLNSLAFERAAGSVRGIAAQELEDSARSSLLEITEREAAVIGGVVERIALADRTAASYLADRLAGGRYPAEAPSVARTADGDLFDPAVDRRTSLYVPASGASQPTLSRDVALTLVLDDLFPSLLPAIQPGVGIYFVSRGGVIRYGPPIDMHEILPPDFDVRVQPVFQLGLPENNPDRETRWTAPYLDDVGNGLLVTVLTPVYAADEFFGVVNIDVSLDRLAARLEELSPLPESFALMLDKEGRLVTTSRAGAASLGIAGEPRLGEALPNAGLGELVASAKEGLPGVSTLEVEDDTLVLAHAPVSGTGWSLVIGAPVSALAAPAEQVAGVIADSARSARSATALAGLAAFVLASVVLAVATRRWVVRPIGQLAAATRRIGAGGLGTALPTAPSGEFRVLGEAFERMSSALAHQRAEILGHQEELESQLSERTRELGNLLAISADLSATLDAAALARGVLARLKEAVGFGSGAVWLVEGGALRRVAVEPASGSTAKPVPTSALLDAFGGDDDGRAAHGRLEGRLEASRPLFAYEPGSVLVVRLTHGSRTLGALALADPAVEGPQHVELVAAVGQQLATALENVRLLLDARERSALEERQHLARELHDSVSQALFGIVLGLHAAKQEVTTPGRLRSSIEYAAELADAGLKEMRALIFELRPEALETEGLVGLLRRQAEMLTARHGLEVDLAAEEPVLEIGTKAVLYRVAQEAVHNVIKHARASRVSIALTSAAGEVRLEVRDDGRGFEKGAIGHESFGLHSMRERMALLGGTLTVDSWPGRGTVVTAELPEAREDVEQQAAADRGAGRAAG